MQRRLFVEVTEGDANMIRELRTQIETAQHNMNLANEAGLTYEASLHRARLDDLIDMATSRGIDTSTWTDSTLRISRRRRGDR